MITYMNDAINPGIVVILLVSFIAAGSGIIFAGIIDYRRHK